MEIDVGKQKTVSVYRERPATPQERKKDSDARIMAEWIHITFSDKEPVIDVVRDLCASS